MRYEHLVQINDPFNPLADTLTRAQLWRGLVLRAEQPTQFVLGLAGSAIRHREVRGDEATLTRDLDFGTFSVHDHVTLKPQQHVQTRTDAGPTWPASRLTITIEAPQPELLFLRFVYEFDEEDDTTELGAQTDALRRQAYMRADLDTVARIRALAEMGELG